MSAVISFLQDFFKIRPTEVRRTGYAFLYLFFAIASFITARIVRSVLFLEIPNYREQLPLTYVAVAITVSSVMLLYAKVERKLRRDQTNMITMVGLIAITLGFRIALDLAHDWERTAREVIYWVFFVWVEVFGAFLIVQFWTFTSEIFHSRQAKRLFAIIGGGGVLSNIIIGFGIGGSIKAIGTDNLLYVICGCLALSLLMVTLLGREAREELTAAKARAPKSKKAGAPIPSDDKVFSTRHTQLIAAVVMLTYMVSTIVDYQFQVIVGDSIAGKDGRTAYFANFFGYTGIIAGVVQFLLTSRILERFGVLFALLLLPCFMLAGSGSLLTVPAVMTGLAAVSFAKGSENVLRYSVNDSALQLLYLPVPAAVRGRAKAFIDGILKPVSLGGAGLILAVCVGRLEKPLGISLGFKLDVYDFSYIAAAALVAWIVALVALRREYMKSLMQTLQKRRLNFEDTDFQITDEGTIKALDTALSSERVGEVLHSLELLPNVARKAREALHPKVADLLTEHAQEVRVAALNYLAGRDTVSDEHLQPMLEDASRDVRAAAILATCAIHREQSLERVHDMLEDCDDKVRAAAVTGLIRHGGLDGVLACADLLKYWLNSKQARDREHAAWVLGEVGVENFYQPLIPLLHDDSVKVRQAAITAAGKLGSSQLLEPLIAQLERPRLASNAVAALVRFGTDIIPTVAKVLADLDRSSGVRTNACKILSRIGDSQCAEILIQHMLDSDMHVRTAAVASLKSIVHRLPGVALDESLVNAAVREEAKRWYWVVALEADLDLGDDSALLKDALMHRQTVALTQVLNLLALKYSTDTLDLVARNLKSKQAARRANAIEVLDNLLERDEKAFIIPIIDSSDSERAAAIGADIFNIARADFESRLKEMLEGADGWMQVCAALEVGNAELDKLEPQVRALLESSNPVCRETAIFVEGKLIGDKVKDLVKDMVDDPARNVSRFARSVLAT